MKRATFISILLGVCLGWCSFAVASEWIEYAAIGGQAYFYDRESAVSSPSDNSARVWTKSVPKSEEDRQKQAKKLTDTLRKGELRNIDLSSLAYTVTLNEINCGKREYRVLSATYYDAQGVVLLSIRSSKRSWELIVPDDPIEALQKAFCPKPAPWWYFWKC